MARIQYAQDRAIGSAVHRRTQQISQFDGLGPPDLCYLVFATKPRFSWFQAEQEVAYYHFVYGLSAGEESQTAAYLASFQQRDKLSLTYGVYCVFDLFSRRDFQLEFRIPGSLNTVAVGESSRQLDVPLSVRDGAFVSSVLRFFYAEPCEPCCRVSPFAKIEDFKYFVEVAVQFIPQLYLPRGDPRDIVRYRQNVLLPAVSNFLLKHRCFRIHLAYFEKLATINPVLSIYLADLAAKYTAVVPVVKRHIQQHLEATPILQFAHAKLCFVNYQYARAVQSLKQALSRDTENPLYARWLVKSYIAQGEWRKAVLALSQAHSEHLPRSAITQFFSTNQHLRGTPPLLASSLEFVWSPPEYYDFRPYRDTKHAGDQSEIRTALESLPASKLSGQKLELYRLLTRIFSSIGWNALGQLRADLFGVGSATLSLKQPKGHSRVSSQQLHQWYASSSSESIQPLSIADDLPIPIEVSQSPSIAKQQTESAHLTEFFYCLWLDLQTLSQWLSEPSETENEDIPYSGSVWIMRGTLAERLHNDRLAESAYRLASHKGFSLFGWSRLLRLHTRHCNPPAAVACVAQILRHLMNEGVVFDQEVPEWLELQLCKLCSGCGLQQLERTLQEQALSHLMPLQAVLERLRMWAVDGT